MPGTQTETHPESIVNINGRLLPRTQAGISPFDSGLQAGDAVWEAMRLRNGRIFKLHEHLERLRSSALALAFHDIPSTNRLVTEIQRTVRANRLHEGSHIRLILTRGVKTAPCIDPQFNQGGPTLIVLPDNTVPANGQSGITLITSSVRRFPPDCLDAKIQHTNLLQSVLAKIQAHHAEADDALLLDQRGFVSQTSEAHVFLVSRGQVLTPRTTSCAEGITRGAVLDLCREYAIPFKERDLSLTEVYCADEMFCTNALCALVPVIEVDGRVIGKGTPGTVTAALSELFLRAAQHEGVPVVEEGSTA